jgi:uncharacterized protein (TIGR03067 family)
MRFLSVVIVAVGLLVAANAPAGDAAKKEMKQLQGTWVVSSFRQDGKAKDEMKGTELIFAGDTVTLRLKKGSDTDEKKMTYKIDPTKKPKAMDVFSGKDPTMRAIYELKGDTLRVCHAKNESERPTEFSDKDKGVIVTLKRKKASE